MQTASPWAQIETTRDHVVSTLSVAIDRLLARDTEEAKATAAWMKYARAEFIGNMGHQAYYQHNPIDWPPMRLAYVVLGMEIPPSTEG